MKRLGIVFICFMVMILFTACDTNKNQNLPNENQSEDLTGKFSGTYQYNPPKDNYYIKWEMYDKEGNSEGYDIYARIGAGYSHLLGEEYCSHANDDLKKLYVMKPENGEWILDPDYDYTSFMEDQEMYGEEIGLANMFEEEFMSYFRTMNLADEKLGEYYVGEEEIAGINCWVFDSKGLNEVNAKYWVDPFNGCTLKYQSSANERIHMVTEYQLNYTEWTDNLAPTDYSQVD